MADIPEHLPSLPPGYEDAIECSVINNGRSPQRSNMVTTDAQPSSGAGQVTNDDSTVRGHQMAKAPPLVISVESEEGRASSVLRESRWLMEDRMGIEDAESLLRACGSDGSFMIAASSSPTIYMLYCRRVSGDGAVDSVENMRIEKTVTGSFYWDGQGEFETLSACAARFMHLNPHKHCPMFANQRVWLSFSSTFTGDVENGFELCMNQPTGDQTASFVALHNTINQNDWFFPALSEEQAAYMLNQHGKSNSFVVSNQPNSNRFVLSTRQPVPDLEQQQDIIEHLRIDKLMEGVFELLGDEALHKNLDAVVQSYRDKNPNMRPLFERQHSGQCVDDNDSVNPPSLFDGEDSEAVLPPDFSDAIHLPNPDALDRLPTVPAVTVPEPDDTTDSTLERTGNTTSTDVGGQGTAAASNRNTSNSGGKCCVIL